MPTTSPSILAGSKVQIQGLQSEEGQTLNGQVGIVDHYSYHRERHAVSLPGASDLKMIKESNLTVLEAPAAAAAATALSKGGAAAATTAVFDDESAMLENLKAMGMPEDMLQNLTPQQKKTMFEMTQREDILQRARKLANIETENGEFQTSSDGSYQWRDANDHLQLQLDCDGGIKTEDVDCKISETTLSLVVKGKSMLDGNLFQNVLPMTCKWALAPNKEDSAKQTMEIKLQKLKPMRWLMVFR